MNLFKPFLRIIPIANRYYRMGFLLFLAWAQVLPVIAAQPLTEDYVLEKVFQKSSVQDWIEGSINEAQSDIDEAKHWDNPSFSYALELPGNRNHNPTENFYLFSQRIDLSGRRGLQLSAANLQLKSVEANVQSRLALFKEEARQRFYDVLHHQQRLTVIDAWTNRLANLEKIIVKREAAGDISGYDFRRLRREYASALTQQRTEISILQHSWERLVSLWDENEPVELGQEVVGELLPSPPIPLQQLLAKLDQNPSLRSLTQQKSALDLKTEAADRWKIPKFDLGIGAKTFDAPNYSDTGLLVTVEVPLPLWSQNNAERLRYRAQAQKAESEYRLMYQQTRGEIRAYWQKLTGLLEAVKTFKEKGQFVSDELIDISISSYYGGEIGILELLDAHREHRSYQLELLGLAYTARKTSIELDRLTAGINP